MTDFDAIVIGAGHNGLAAAAQLARAGWRVLVAERNERVGGAVQSGEITRPGWVHDLWSTNQNLFRASPVYEELKTDLERHGLRYRVSDKPFCNVFPGGRSVRIYKDAERTMAGLRAHDPRDAEGWQRLQAHYEAFSKALLPLYQSPLPSADAGWKLAQAATKVGMDELLELGHLLFSSTRELSGSYFHTEEMRALIATWGMHLDFGPDVAGGAMFPFLESYANAAEGMSLAEGGASRMPEALAAIVREHGGEVRTGAPVARVLVEGGRATGVELASGERIGARRAVVANLVPRVLAGLVGDEALPEEYRRKVDAYVHGPATMMVHLALREPPRWAAGDELREFAYVHVAPYTDDLARCYTQSMNGLIPDSPLLIVGQTSAVDPTRVPDGEGAILWIQVRTLPREIRGDAAGTIDARDWDAAKDAMAERVLDKLEEYAPGVRGQILERVVYSPADLERANPNLIGGDSIGGSHHPRQNFLFRPFPQWSRYRTPVDHLYMVGAATWPGGGVNATSGWLAAKAILSPHPVRNTLLAGAGAAAAAATVIAALKRDRGGPEA